MTPGLLTPDQCRRLVLEFLAPEASSSAWDWACAHLVLGAQRYEPERAGLMRHWLDLAGARISGRPLPRDPMAHLCEQLYLIASAQLAKTTLGLAIVAWVLAEHPREIAWYGTRGKDLARLRRRALLPIIERSAPLARLLPLSQEARDRALGADLLQVGGSLLYLLIGNLIGDLRSLPLPLILLDEFDQLADDIDGQGDPIDLALVRQRTMPHDRLLYGATTPSGVARHGWRRLCSGSHERPLVVCPDCGGCDYLNDLQIQSAGDLPLASYPAAVILRERLARWACRHCGTLHKAAAVRAMVRDCERASRWVAGTWSQTDDHPAGVWVPASVIDSRGRLVEIVPPETTIRSGWANALYSRDVTLDGFAAAMVAKLHHGTDAEKRAWTNTEAARPWLASFRPATTDEIADAACRDYPLGSCPADGIEWLVLTWDQQGNQAGRFWFAGVLRAWRLGGESWLVWAGKAQSEHERDEIEDRLWPIGTRQRAADLVAMDVANPNYRQRGYLWAAENPRRRICLRGDVRLHPGETWRAVEPSDPRKQAKTSRPAEVHEWRIHPHHWRSELHDRMLASAGHPPWHLPGDPPADYLRSLNAEERSLETRRVTGGGYEEVLVWVPRVTTATDESVSVRKDLHWADGEKMQLALADIFGYGRPLDDPAAAGQAARPEPDDEPAPAVTDDDAYFGGVW